MLILFSSAEIWHYQVVPLHRNKKITGKFLLTGIADMHKKAYLCQETSITP